MGQTLETTLHHVLACSPVEYASEEATIYAALIHHERVFLVVPTVAGNGNYGIDACRQVISDTFSSNALPKQQGWQWSLTVASNTRHQEKVCSTRTAALLKHQQLQSVCSDSFTLQSGLQCACSI